MNQIKVFIPLLFILFFSFTAAQAQTSGKKKKESSRENWDSPTRNPEEIFKSPERSRSQKTKTRRGNKRNKPVDVTMVKYEQQKKENAKKYAKMEKEMKKPQNSDPSYFGHKKKPKKRPLKKRKFCHECGITH